MEQRGERGPSESDVTGAEVGRWERQIEASRVVRQCVAQVRVVQFEERRDDGGWKDVDGGKIRGSKNSGGSRFAIGGFAIAAGPRFPP